MARKNFILILFLLVILIIGCKPPTSSSSDTSSYRQGTSGLVMNFLSGAPPSNMYADSNEIDIPISIEVRNKGAYPTSDDSWNDGNVIFISGFDAAIISSWELDGGSGSSASLSGKADVLEGKSINNPEGGYDLLEFIGTADLGTIDIEKYTPNFLVTACYDYKTKASPNVCIDPRPFTTVKENKVCDIHDVSLDSQGAPVAITKVESKALSSSLQFKIHFKNVGKGDVIKFDSLSKCSTDGEKLGRKDMDIIEISDVKIGNKGLTNCKGDVRLINNEGFIVCYLDDYKEESSAYTTPLYIEIAYGYRSTISKSVEIVKVPDPK